MRRWTLVIILLAAMSAMAQTAPQDTGAVQAEQPAAPAYQPKFPGDPAHSDSEAAALAYLRVLSRAETLYFKMHKAYTTSLRELAGHGSFTKRMVTPQRGDYTVKFHSTGKEYTVEMVPQQIDAQHRAFFVDDSGNIRGEEDKVADAKSPEIR